MGAKERLTDEQSTIAKRLSLAARSWTQEDALVGRHPPAEAELLLDALNELNVRRLRNAELEAALHRINALNDNPARFNREIQDVIDSVIDTSDVKFS